MARVRRRLTATGFSIVGIFLLLITGDIHAGLSQSPVLGKDAISDAGLIEDHSQALVRWAQKEIKNAVLVNVDAHDDLRWIGQEKTAALKKILGRQDWKTLAASDSSGEKGLYHPGSFIFAAARLGIIREVYWIIPFSYFEAPTDLKQIKAFLAYYGFPANVMDTLILDDHCCRGVIDRIPLTVCGLEHLPEIQQEILLSIDADFFPAFADWYGQDLLSSISGFFTAAAEKKYLIRDAIVAFSVNGGFCDAARRWIGEVCSEMLAKPGLINGAFPESWLVKNLADIYYFEEQAGSLLDLTGRFLSKYPLDPCLMTYRCFALMALGDIDSAYGLACKAARIDKRYAFALADLGQCLLDRGDTDRAVRFFESAYERYPQMNFRQKNLGDGLFEAGRYEQALVYYDQFYRHNGPFPVAFTMGLALLRMGNEAAAEKWFDVGVESLKHNRYLSIKSDIDADAIRQSVMFFRQKEQPDKADEILSYSVLKEAIGHQPSGP